MNITIVTIGKINKPFITKGIQEYNKRLSRYCKVKHIVLKKIEHLQRSIKNRPFIIAVNSRGTMLSSESLGEHIKNRALQGQSNLLFLVAEDELPPIPADKHLALTSMEMDEELMTLTLYEQIYRAFTILNNLPYHK